MDRVKIYDFLNNIKPFFQDTKQLEIVKTHRKVDLVKSGGIWRTADTVEGGRLNDTKTVRFIEYSF